MYMYIVNIIIHVHVHVHAHLFSNYIHSLNNPCRGVTSYRKKQLTDQFHVKFRLPVKILEYPVN